MGRAKRTRKFAQVKRVLSSRDARLKKNQAAAGASNSKPAKDAEIVHEMSSSLFSPRFPSLPLQS